MGNPRSINQRKFPDTGVIYQYRDNNLAEIMPDKLNELIKYFQEEKSKDSM